MVTEKTRNELKEQARKSGYDLLHELLLTNIIRTSDGFYLQQIEGDVGYNRFLGNPNLNDTVLGRMDKELKELSEPAREESIIMLKAQFPEIARKLEEFKKRERG